MSEHAGRRCAADRRRRRKPASVLIIGSGPVVIGQAAEFDYAGTQACRALREEGIRTILLNSNPATIMTDPGVADAVYLEPLTVASVERILERERPGRHPGRAGRPDGAQPGRGRGARRPAGALRHAAAGHVHRGHRDGRGPGARSGTCSTASASRMRRR